MCSPDKHSQWEVKLFLWPLSNVPAHHSVMSPWPKSQALQSALQHSLKFSCRWVSNFTLYGTLLGERPAIPKPQVYPLPQAIWMFRDLSGKKEEISLCCSTKQKLWPPLMPHFHLDFPIDKIQTVVTVALMAAVIMQKKKQCHAFHWH